MTGSRRKARETVLQALYWSATSGDPVVQTLRTMSIRSDLSAEATSFATKLGRLAWDNRDALDAMIGRVSENWAVERISRIDRILIWVSLTEMREFPDIPVKVSIDEAIELAKRYSVEKAPSFINGILDRLAREIGREGDVPAPVGPATGEEAGDGSPANGTAKDA